MKKTKNMKNKQYPKKLSDLFMTRNQLIKNSIYYNRLYTTKPNSINMSSSIIINNTNNLILSSKNFENSKSNNNNTNNNNSKKNLSKKKLSPKKKHLWPKLTKPKWPFSVKRNEPRLLIQNRLSSAKPSSKYHNFSTIRWLNQKYTDSVKQKSLFSLLPNKGKVIVPEVESEKSKRHRKIMEYLESFSAPKAREKNVEINPKYFYNKETFEKIQNMKDMFIAFDKEGKQKMLLKEMVRLFKNNGIEVDINEIKDLFFKNIANTKNENLHFKLLYLDFYQFLNFALSSDQDFRLFIRELKKKTKNKTEKKGIYFPMNFNLALDYFMRKEKQNNSIKAVKNAIKDMDRMMKLEDDEQNEKNDLIIDDFNLSLKTNNTFFISSKKNNNKISKNFNNSKEENYFKDINFAKLIEEFSNLFGINTSKKDLNESYFNKKRKIKSATIRNRKKLGENAFTEDIKHKLRNEDLKNLNIQNFQRYNNLRLALQATKEQIKYMKMHNNNNGLIEEDKNITDLVDIRDVTYQSNHLFTTENKIFNIKNEKFFENFDNSLLINVYLDNRNKNREKKSNKTKAYSKNKKTIWNFYCGSPRDINNNIHNLNSKYDFVPNELFKKE